MVNLLYTPPHDPMIEPGTVKKPKPYLGITGFMTREEIDDVIGWYYRNKSFSDVDSHDMMIGILLTRSVFDAGVHPNASRRSRYPALDDISSLLEHSDGKNIVRFIHYHTSEMNLFPEVEMIMDRWEGLVDGIQFNVSFPPDSTSLMKIASTWQGLKLVLQVNRGAINKYEDDFSTLVSMIYRYYQVHYVLIDPSGGSGIPIDVDRSSLLYDQIYRPEADFLIGFAGGIHDKNVSKIVEQYKIRLDTTAFCIDAGSGLRDPSSDVMIRKRARGYIRSFFESIA